ncbi:MAG: acetyltransferase [Candidatus Omnitrophota bacterium]|nr:acetyltransferase [Candidatus Omnitrophota bacterium]
MKRKEIRKKIPVAVVSADKEIIELIEESPAFDIIGIIDTRKDVDTLGYPLLGEDFDWPQIVTQYKGLKIILAIDPPEKKRKLAFYYGIKSLASLISKDAHVSPSAILREGCLVQQGVKIMSSVKIGIACKVNVNAVVHHDTVVGNFCTLAPGSMLLGAVKIEDNVFVGAGAIVLPKVHVGRNSIIGAGAVVVKDVGVNSVVAGVPAKKLVK